MKANTLNLFLMAASLLGVLGCQEKPSSSLSKNDVSKTVINTEDCPWTKASNWQDTISLINQPQILPYTFGDDEFYEDKLVPSEVRQDLACLKIILRTGYSGTDQFFKKGIDLLQRVDELYGSLPEHFSQERFAELLLDVHAGAFDGHLKYGRFRFKKPNFYVVPLKFEKTGQLYSAAVNGKSISVAACENLTAIPFVGDSQLNEYFTFAGILFQGAQATGQAICTDHSNGEVLLPLEQRDIDPSQIGGNFGAPAIEYQELVNGIQYLKINDWTDFLNTDQQKFLDEFAKKDAPPLIIDLRGNGGGAPAFEMALKDLLVAEDQKIFGGFRHKYDSLINFAGITKYYEDFLATVKLTVYPDEATNTHAINEANRLLNGWNQVV